MAKDDNKKDVIPATVVEDENANKPEEGSEQTPPPAEGTTEKTEGFFTKIGKGVKKVGAGVKNGTSKVLKYKFSIGQVLGAAAIVGAAVLGAKAIYEKGRKDGGDIDDENLLDNDDMLAIEGEDSEELLLETNDAEGNESAEIETTFEFDDEAEMDYEDENVIE